MNEHAVNPKARTKARYCATQALYQWQVANHDLARIESEFLGRPDVGQMDLAYFRELLHEVPKQLEALDLLLTPHLDRQLHELGLIELAILRIGAYELSVRQEIPYKVVVNEAIELAKLFGADESYKYINAVLGAIVGECRKDIREN